jgi:hypothetical protein
MQIITSLLLLLLLLLMVEKRVVLKWCHLPMDPGHYNRSNQTRIVPDLHA